MLHKKHTTANGSGFHAIQKLSARAPKSSAAPAMTPMSLASDAEEDGDDDGDSSATEQPDESDSDSEPDVRALPALGKARVKRAGPRVAGLNKIMNGNTADNGDNEANNDEGNVNMTDVTHDVTNLDSDDEDYAAVDEVSDGEDSVVHDDENTLLRYAEKDLIQEFEHAEQRHNAGVIFEGLTEMGLDDDQAGARRLSLYSADDNCDTNDFDINLDEDPFAGLPTTETLYNDMLQDAELAIWRMPHVERKDSDTSTTARKRVRFEEVDSRVSSDSDSDEETGVEFPDLFATEDDPILKQRLALANARETHTMLDDRCDSESVYDFDGEEEKIAFELDEDSSSDDYESSYDSEDDGDTTDEESAEDQIARMLEMKKALGKATNSQPSTPASAKKVVRKAIKTPTPTPTRRSSKAGKGPVAGTFALDPTRASMSANAAGTKIQVRPPTKPSETEKQFWERARTVNSSRRGSSQGSSYLTVASPVANDVPTRPFTAQSTLGSMFDGKLDIIRNNDVNGIADDIYPAMWPTRASFVSTDSNETGDNEIQDVDMNDFIALDYSESDDEDQGMATPNDKTPFTGRDSFSTSMSDKEHRGSFGSTMLEHLSHCSSVVGSFRQNQHLAKHVSSLASHPSKRASASEYNALQKGRRGAGNSPLTPVRKSRNSQDFSSSAGVKKSFNSPQNIQRPRSRGNSVHLKSVALQQTLANHAFGN